VEIFHGKQDESLGGPVFVKSYNNSTHRTIGMKPVDVNEENKDEVWTRV
jgi:hypothetical protein